MDHGPQRDKVAGDWRRFHNEELHDIHLSPNFFSSDQIKKHKLGGAYSTYEGEESTKRDLVRKHRGRRTLGRPSCKEIILKWVFKK
jgi:hypothetical protein